MNNPVSNPVSKTVDKIVNIVGVQFREAGKIYDFETARPLTVGENVIVETERGQTLAVVADVRVEQASKYKSGALKKIIRGANYKDFSKNKDLNDESAMEVATKKVEQLKLEMRILKAEVSMGGNKVIVFFTAPDRVDFRELLKQLASSYRARVELKQVGPRDEAKILGGVGVCGRAFCCSTFLREFVPVSIKMAKNQNLALNPNKVSGGCGRLLCCLTYENTVYTKLRSTMPKVGAKVTYGGEQIGRVLRIDIFNQTVTLEDAQGMTVDYDVDEIKVLPVAKPKAKPKGKPKKTSQNDDWGKDIDLKELME